jgi:hypothetical protein
VSAIAITSRQMRIPRTPIKIHNAHITNSDAELNTKNIENMPAIEDNAIHESKKTRKSMVTPNMQRYTSRGEIKIFLLRPKERGDRSEVDF